MGFSMVISVLSDCTSMFFSRNFLDVRRAGPELSE